MKLLFRVTSLIIAILVFAFGVIFYITWTSNVKSLDAQAKARLEELAFNVMDKIDRTLFERIGDLKAIATDPIISSKDSSPRQITERLITYRNIYKTYVSLSFLDLDRIRIADTAGLDLGKQVEKQQYWDDVMQGKLSVASAIGFSGSLNLPVIFFASPVKDKDKELVGIVVTRVPVDKLYEIVGQVSTTKQMNEALYIDLVNRDGLLIYSNYNRKGMLKDKSPAWERIKNLPGERLGIVKRYKYSSGEESILVFCREQGYLDFKGNGWTLMIHIPTRKVFAPIVELRKKWLIAIVPSIILTIIFVLIISYRFSRPLSDLRDAVVEFGKGDLDTKVTIESRDEIGELGKVFNQMGENLKATTTSIDNLEREITKRKRMEDRIRKLTQMQTLLLDPDILEMQLKKITDGVVDIFNADFCRIWLIAQGDRCDTGCAHAAVTEGPHVCRYRDRCLHLVASSGRYTHLDGETHRRVPFGCYKIGGIASGEDSSFLTNDVTNDPRVHNHEWAKQLGLVSFAGFQLRPPHGETKGVLALFSQSVISDEEYSLLEGVSNLTMRVIQTAQAQEALKESERKFRTIFDSANDGMFLLDLETKKFVMCNEMCSKMLGFTQEEFLNLFIADLHPSEDLPFIFEQTGKFLEGGEGGVRADIRFRRKDGTVFFTDLSPALMTLAGRKFALVVFNDITERKKAEGEIKKYHTLFETSTDAIMMLTKDGGFFDGNQAAFDLFGFSSKEDFLQMRPSELSPPTQPDGKDSLTASLEHIETALTTGSDSFEWLHKKKDGALFTGEIRMSTLELGEKKVLQALVRDITERKRAREEREKLIVELRASLEKVKTLSGLLPICASCKKIRDDKGYWNQIESYIRDHSEAEFSHGICPECMKKLYPDFEIVE